MLQLKLTNLAFSRLRLLSPAASEGCRGGSPRPRPAQAGRHRGEGLGDRHPAQDAQGLETLSAPLLSTF